MSGSHETRRPRSSRNSEPISPVISWRSPSPNCLARTRVRYPTRTDGMPGPVRRDDRGSLGIQGPLRQSRWNSGPISPAASWRSRLSPYCRARARFRHPTRTDGMSGPHAMRRRGALGTQTQGPFRQSPRNSVPISPKSLEFRAHFAGHLLEIAAVSALSGENTSPACDKDGMPGPHATRRPRSSWNSRPISPVISWGSRLFPYCRARTRVRHPTRTDQMHGRQSFFSSDDRSDVRGLDPGFPHARSEPETP